MNSKKKRRGQMSEAFCTAMFLSLSGGLQDVYTYLFRGKVFANAQTGNIVLMAVHAFAGEWGRVLHYLVPLCFFALGVFAAELMHQKLQNMQRLHWRQLVVLCEIVMLFVVGFFPQEWNLYGQCTGLVCLCDAGADLPQGERLCLCQHHVHRQHAQRHGLPSRSWVLNRNPAALKKSFYYLGIILLFALGAGLGSLTLDPCGAKAIWFSCLPAGRQLLPDVPERRCGRDQRKISKHWKQNIKSRSFPQFHAVYRHAKGSPGRGTGERQRD